MPAKPIVKAFNITEDFQGRSEDRRIRKNAGLAEIGNGTSHIK